ncbi:MAG: hypothetical protein JWM40_511 [Frankiales bacterium]|nr:hypothetical protein [Frankiales bacterium]
MYDHLDDPTPPPPGDETRAEVLARAGRLRRKRLALLTSGASAAVVVVVVAVLALTGSSDRASLIVVSPTPTVTASETAEPTPSATPSAAGSPTTGPTPTRTATTAPTASATTDVRCQSLDCPDGKPGWTTGYTQCIPATVEPDGAGAPPVDGLVLTLALPASAASGTDVHGTATVTNNSDVTVSFEVRQPRIGAEAGVSGAGGTSSTHASDAQGSEAFQLSPGQADSINVVAHTTSCGDTSRDPEPSLSPGTYQVGLTMGFTNAQVVPSGSAPSPQVRSYGSWSVAQALRIT